MSKRKPTVIALIVVVAVGLAVLLTLRRPVPSPPQALHPTARQVVQAQNHLEAVQRQIQQAEAGESTRPPGRPKALPPRPLTLRLSQDDLNIYLSGSKAAHKLLSAHGVKAVQLLLSEPAGLTIRAAVSVKNQTQNVQIDGNLTPDPKLGLRYTAIHAQVGRLLLPPTVVTAQANALATRIAGQMHGHLPLAVQSVQVQGKMLVLTGLPTRRKAAERAAIKPPAPASPPPASPAPR